jgi:hypothetical protein
LDINVVKASGTMEEKGQYLGGMTLHERALKTVKKAFAE